MVLYVLCNVLFLITSSSCIGIKDKERNQMSYINLLNKIKQ